MSQYAQVVRPKLVAAVQSPSDVVASHLADNQLLVVFRDGSVAATQLDEKTPTWTKVIAGPDYNEFFNN